MKYGTMIDIILRDSNFNVYYVPAIVGDAKAHTLNMDYKTAGIKNGIYQTGVSLEIGQDEASTQADGAVIEFIRDYSKAEKDLMRTPEFDILQIIVYDQG